MAIRFGVSPIAWTNDDLPELGGETPLTTMLTDAAQLGFAGVELGGKFPRQAATLKPLLGEYGLELVGGWYSGALLTRSAQAEIEAMQEHLALLDAMGSKVCIFAETSNAIHCLRRRSLSDSPKLDAAGWSRFGAALSDVAEYVERRGLRFAYHHHLGTVVENSADIGMFLHSTSGRVGLTLDTGHAALARIDPLEIIRKYPQRIAHVHCKDVRQPVFDQLMQSGGSFLDGVIAGMFTVPGDGGLEYGAIMAALAQIGYSGWIIVEAEQDPARAAPREYSALGLATLRRALALAGMTEAA
jgi:inosose dehydratase